MVTRLFFNEVIKDVLDNIYDIASLETHPALFSVIKLPNGFTGSKGEYVRQFMIDAIEQLRPPRKELSLTAPEWRPYIILNKRYIEGLGSQELADLLAISQRQMRRDHHKALTAITEIVWAICYPNEKPDSDADLNPIIDVHNEMIDPIETTRGVYGMLKKQFDLKNINVEFLPPEGFTPVITDRVILRQVLISLFNDILHNQSGDTLQIRCDSSLNQVLIEFTSIINCNNFDCEPAPDETIADEFTAVNYWCERIHSHVEEICINEKSTRLVKRTLWLPHSDQKIMLVIDDQEPVVNLFKRYLSQTDILIVGVSHPEEAIPLARHLRPALITLDVMMPQMDGWELLQLIKLDEMLKSIPVIICSAWDDPDLSRSLGAQIYLKKPVTQKMLLEAVNILIAA
ncbi:MAG: response regulator [Anaerolineaceae bacterium]